MNAWATIIIDRNFTGLLFLERNLISEQHLDLLQKRMTLYLFFGNNDDITKVI
jgi:hypothetical protein